MTRRGRSRVYLVLLAAVAAAACSSPAPPPPPGEPEKPEIVLSTPAQDRKAGAEAAEQVRAQMGTSEDPALTSYVASVGQRLVPYAPRMGFEYRFHVVNQDSPNAFALPGGYIYVSRGLLVLTNDEDELANVLGHEIVHVARRHAAARQSVMQALPPIFQMVGMSQVAAFGRDQEREADRLGQELAALAGYDPVGMADFLTQLEYTERLRLGFSRMPNFLDTHPTTQERVSAAGARGRSIQWVRQPGVAPDRSAYLRGLDGLLIGTGGAEGVFRGDRFLHPDLGFSVRFPPNWQVMNTPLAVGGISPRRDAMVTLEFQGTGEDLEKAADEFLAKAENEGLRVERRLPVVLGEIPGFRVEGRANTMGGSLQVHITWLVWQGTIYRIIGVAQGVDRGPEAIFQSVARSFRPLNPRERSSIRETRLRIVPARGGESVAQLSERTRDAWNIQELAVMNGVFANARFEEGQLVKVAVSQPYKSAPER